MNGFLFGAIAMGYVVAGLFFAKFWRRSGDLLFAIFALAFWLLALSQAVVAVVDVPREEHSWAYLPRLLAFALIIVAIVYKNTVSRARPE